MALAVVTLTATGTANAATTTTTTCKGSGQTGMQSGTITVGGKTRTYEIYVPTSWTGKTKVPVVYYFHGMYGQAVDQVWASQFWKDADKYGFLVVGPQAGGDPIDWDTHTGTDVATSDANFVLQLQQAIATKWCVDTTRQFAAGYSSGSNVTQQLACYGVGNFKAYAGSAYTAWPSGCPNKSGFDYTYFHGTADPFDPFWGDSNFPSVQYSMYQMAATDGCSTTDPNQITTVASDVTKYTWTTCTAGHHIDVYIMDGAGHIWPGSDYIASLGPQPKSLVAADVLTAAWGLNK